MLPLPRKHTLRRTECCACHDFGNGSPKCCACNDVASPEPRARQHPSPLDSCHMLPLPRKHTLRCTECCACHDFGNGISKVLRLPRFREPRAVRATTSQPFRQLPHAAPAHKHTHTQMHRMLRLPRLRQWQSAAPASISRPPTRARDNIPDLQTAAKCCPCHANTHSDAQKSAPATTSAMAFPKCCACHAFASPKPRSAMASPKCCACHDFASLAEPRARQHPSPLDSCQMLPLSHKHTLRCTECCACHDFGNGISQVLRLPRFREPRAARATTSQPFRQLPHAAPAYKHTLRCTECCACHDFGNGISKVLRLPRFREPRAARATTSQPFRQLPNAALDTQTHTQMHRMLRLPRLRQWHLQSAAAVTISRPPSRARDNIPAL